MNWSSQAPTVSVSEEELVVEGRKVYAFEFWKIARVWFETQYQVNFHKKLNKKKTKMPFTILQNMMYLIVKQIVLWY